MCWPVMEGLESEPTLFIDAPYSALILYIFQSAYLVWLHCLEIAHVST
jgi:hypothetical protein